ncbi:hypothetical protein P9112_003797 [Eukaryota sp. TZLM1-RC]
MSLSHPFSSPLDLLKACLSHPVLVKLRNRDIMEGTLHAYDQHFNVVLSNVTYTTTLKTLSSDDLDTAEIQLSKQSTNHELLFVRGDNVLLVSPVH